MERVKLTRAEGILFSRLGKKCAKEGGGRLLKLIWCEKLSKLRRMNVFVIVIKNFLHDE